MKKIINTSIVYAIAAMAGGVFYREFTKFNGFEGKTSLLFIHPHLFMLGVFMFLIIALFNSRFYIVESKKFKPFYIIYNLGMVVTALTFLWRGVLQVLGTELTKAVDASISGIAGLGHMLIGVGIIIILLAIKEKVLVKNEQSTF